jgi:hypothetical protein
MSTILPTGIPPAFIIHYLARSREENLFPRRSFFALLDLLVAYFPQRGESSLARGVREAKGPFTPGRCRERDRY